MDLLQFAILLQVIILIRLFSRDVSKQLSRQSKEGLTLEIDIQTQKARREMAKFSEWIDTEVMNIEKRLETLSSKINVYNKIMEG